MLSPNLSRTILLHPLLIPNFTSNPSSSPRHRHIMDRFNLLDGAPSVPRSLRVAPWKIEKFRGLFKNGDVVRGSVGETTRFHYNGGEPPGKVRSLAADLSFRDERNWRELCRQVSTVKKRKWKSRGRARVTQLLGFVQPSMRAEGNCINIKKYKIVTSQELKSHSLK